MYRLPNAGLSLVVLAFSDFLWVVEKHRGDLRIQVAGRDRSPEVCPHKTRLMTLQRPVIYGYQEIGPSSAFTKYFPCVLYVPFVCVLLALVLFHAICKILSVVSKQHMRY